MIYLLDTDVIIDMLRDVSRWLPTIAFFTRNESAISAMTFGEIWEGIEANPSRLDAIPTLDDIISPFRVLEIGVPTMKIYGKIRVHLRRHGEMIGTPDILIASTAIEHHLTLVTRNTRHFGRIPNLQILHPSEIGS